MIKNFNPKKLMIRSIIIAINLLLISFSSNIIFADENNSISIVYSFEKPQISSVIIGQEKYDRILLKDTISTANPNNPCLPIKGAYILLPKNTKNFDITVEKNTPKSLGLNYLIEPAGTPIPISDSESFEIPDLKPNQEIYSLNEKFPINDYTIVGSYSFRGYQILVLELYPVKYVPLTGEILYYDNLMINIEIIEGQNENSLYRNLVKDEFEILKKIDNSESIKTYQTNHKQQNIINEIDLLIITTDNLKRSFRDLKNYHDSEGIKTEIVTLSEIGGEDPETIRDYIRDSYLNSGIDYVILGGDHGIVPAKELWVYGLDEETTPYTTYMPSDIYYSCLDGPFNYDNDEKWGEPNDGENGNDIDLFAEVYVGRACVDNSDEADIFVEKTIAQINAHVNNDEYLKEFLLLGENLGDFGIASWAGNYLDQIINGSNDDGYDTVGIPLDEYNIETMYDRDNKWTKNDIIERINNNNIYVINHDGHSNTYYNMRLGYDDVFELNNEKTSFIYSQGCNSGGFDAENCIAEAFTVKSEYGAFAGIWNARFGWFWAYRTDGDSQRYHREFWDAVFGENIPEIGKANQDSKEDNIFLIGRSCMRWCFYQLNLFGDPTLSFYYNKPKKPETPTGIKTGKAEFEYNYSTNAIDPNDNQLFYKWDFGDGNYSEWIGPYNSGETCTISYKWNQGDYDIKVKAKDTDENESPWSDPLPIKMSHKRASYLQINELILKIFNIIEKYYSNFFTNL
jgi:hypothetical protein